MGSSFKQSNFGKQLSATTLSGRFSSFGEQLCGAAGEQLCGAALGSSFGKQEQLGGAACAAASNRSFENRSFGEQFWGLALERNFGGQLFGSNFAEQLSGAALENSFQIWGAALGTNRFEGSFGATALRRSPKRSSCGEPLWGAALRSSLHGSFEQQLWGLALERNFGEQLSVATLGSSFREPLWRIALGSRFGEQV